MQKYRWVRSTWRETITVLSFFVFHSQETRCIFFVFCVWMNGWAGSWYRFVSNTPSVLCHETPSFPFLIIWAGGATNRLPYPDAYDAIYDFFNSFHVLAPLYLSVFTQNSDLISTDSGRVTQRFDSFGWEKLLISVYNLKFNVIDINDILVTYFGRCVVQSLIT